MAGPEKASETPQPKEAAPEPPGSSPPAAEPAKTAETPAPADILPASHWAQAPVRRTLILNPVFRQETPNTV